MSQDEKNAPVPVFEVQSAQTVLIGSRLFTRMLVKTVYPDEDSIRAYLEEALRTGEVDIEGYDPQVRAIYVFPPAEPNQRFVKARINLLSTP